MGFKRKVATSIFNTENVYSSYCLTLGEIIGGDLIEVDGTKKVAKQITRAGVMLLKDENGFVYKIEDTCLVDPSDLRKNEICSNCEYYWFSKMKKREYLLIGTTIDHSYIFGKKLANFKKKLTDYIDKITAKQYIYFFANTLNLLSLIDNSVIVPYSDSISVMFGELKRINESDLYVLVITDFENGERSVESSLISKNEIIDVIDGDNAISIYVETANVINKNLINNLNVF